VLDASDVERQTEFSAKDLQGWIDAGWLVPRPRTRTQRLSEVDLARARLIHDLKHNIGVNDDGVGVILGLIDQIHGLRAILDDIVSAVCIQPEAVQRRIGNDVRRVAQSGRAHRRAAREKA
jgi:chaperone modulatory protein CbpM